MRPRLRPLLPSFLLSGFDGGNFRLFHKVVGCGGVTGKEGSGGVNACPDFLVFHWTVKYLERKGVSYLEGLLWGCCSAARFVPCLLGYSRRYSLHFYFFTTSHCKGKVSQITLGRHTFPSLSYPGLAHITH